MAGKKQPSEEIVATGMCVRTYIHTKYMCIFTAFSVTVTEG